jgi:hypothetical protein
VTELNLEMYARLIAHIACRRGVGLGKLAAELGVDIDELHAAEVALRDKLAGAFEQRAGIVSMKFAAALGAELQRLGPLGGDGAAAPPPELVPVLAEAPAVPDVAKPSYLQASPPALTAGELTLTAETDRQAIIAAIQSKAVPFNPSAQSSLANPEPRDEEARRAPRKPEGGPSTAVLPVMSDEIDLRQYPIELYAAITGAIARGAFRDRVLAAHHIAPELFDRIAKAWGARFAAEPHLLARFQELVRSHGAGGRT